MRNRTKQNTPFDWILLAIALLIGGLSCATQCSLPSHAGAQLELDPEHLVLARLCVHEAGWGRIRHGRWIAPSADCAAIDAVIERVQAASSRARGIEVSYVDALRLYSGSIFDLGRRDAKAFVPWLDLTGTAPRRWRGSVPWSSRRDAWAAILDAAERIREGSLQHSCTQPPHHWGCGDQAIADGCRDHERAMRLGMEQVDCGPTHNRFYRVPRLSSIASEP